MEAATAAAAALAAPVACGPAESVAARSKLRRGPRNISTAHLSRRGPDLSEKIGSCW